MQAMGAITNFDKDVTLDEALAIVHGDMPVAPSDAAWARCDAAFARLQRHIQEARHVYGITTGFGPLANRLIDPADGAELQQNLVHHLATGLGPPVPWAPSRAIVLDRLLTIMRGVSGASRPIVHALVTLLNSPLAPVMPERGTVGASGDLTPLAHLALALQGRGGFMHRDGRLLSGQDGLKALELAPLDLRDRDGLAMVNGTSAMTGIALCNSGRAHRLLHWAVALSAALLEVLRGRQEAWSSVLSDIRPHPGQAKITHHLRQRIAKSDRLADDPIAARRLSPDGFVTEPVAGQDAYSLRCVPQILGAVHDTLTWHDQILVAELNGVTDNPIFPIDGLAVHGGNFMGQHIALASDALATACVVAAGLAERQIARVTDEKLNGGLPAFLHRGAEGLNSGLMGAQVTASATLAEMRHRGPVSVHSISTNGANQDVVSMGTIAARTVQTQLSHFAEILAIEAMCVAQAIDIREADSCAAFSPAACAMRDQIRDVTPPLDRDRPLSDEINALAEVIASHEPAPGTIAEPLA